MKELPLIVLYDEHSNTSRTYIEYLKRNGLKAKEIVILKFITPKTKKIAKYLGRKLAYIIFSAYKAFKNKSSTISHSNALTFQDGFEAIDYSSAINLKDYASQVSTLYLESFEDDVILDYVSRNTKSHFLYTAGGIVPKKFLSIKDLKILHIHPGVVPFVKGSDGFFWSVLIRHKPGASCFYMDETIDTGAIIHTKDFAAPQFSRSSLSGLSDQDIYNHIINYYDPHLRATVLIETLEKTKNLTNIASTKQDPIDGCTYFTMHPKLIRKTIEKLLK